MSAKPASPTLLMSDPTGAAPGVFATTHWTMVLDAGDAGSPSARGALEALCRTYWYPLYAQIRRRGYGEEDARDLTQEFFASLLRHESLAQVRRERGRFRTFLLRSLQHFLADQSDRSRALKRGGGVPTVALDALDAEARYALEPATDETPDREFDRRWAAALMERVFSRLAAEQAAAGKGATFDCLKSYLARDVEPGEYTALEGRLGLGRNAIAAAVSRLRHRCRQLALAEVMHTVCSPGDAEQELRQLLSGA